jgi:hypothetical protein
MPWRSHRERIVPGAVPRATLSAQAEATRPAGRDAASLLLRLNEVPIQKPLNHGRCGDEAALLADVAAGVLSAHFGSPDRSRPRRVPDRKRGSRTQRACACTQMRQRGPQLGRGRRDGEGTASGAGLLRWPGFTRPPGGQWPIGGLGPRANDAAGERPTITRTNGHWCA